jgi:hypothetical protein
MLRVGAFCLPGRAGFLSRGGVRSRKRSLECGSIQHQPCNPAPIQGHNPRSAGQGVPRLPKKPGRGQRWGGRTAGDNTTHGRAGQRPSQCNKSLPALLAEDSGSMDAPVHCGDSSPVPGKQSRRLSWSLGWTRDLGRAVWLKLCVRPQPVGIAVEPLARGDSDTARPSWARIGDAALTGNEPLTSGPPTLVPLRSAVLMPDSALGYQFAGTTSTGDICPQNRLQPTVEQLQLRGGFRARVDVVLLVEGG